MSEKRERRIKIDGRILPRLMQQLDAEALKVGRNRSNMLEWILQERYKKQK